MAVAQVLNEEFVSNQVNNERNLDRIFFSLQYAASSMVQLHGKNEDLCGQHLGDIGGLVLSDAVAARRLKHTVAISFSFIITSQSMASTKAYFVDELDLKRFNNKEMRPARSVLDDGDGLISYL